MENDTLTLIKQWQNGIKIDQIAHKRAAAHYTRCGRLLGIPVTMLSIIVGTSIFSTIGSTKKEWLLIIAGIISILTAIFSGLQTFLNYPELAEKHHTASIKYGQLRRHIEEIIALPLETGELQKAMTGIREAWTSCEEESPDVPQSFHDQALRIVKPELAVFPVK